jgi:YD repeat-containing protein
MLFLLQSQLSIPRAQETVDYTYDDLGRLETVTYGDGTLVQYSYDPAGNRTSQVISGTGVSGGLSPAVNLVVLPISGFVVIPVRNPDCGIVGGC